MTKDRNAWLPDKLFGFPECAKQTAELAHAIGVTYEIVGVHRFPDGESLVRISGGAKKTAILRSLHHPNEKLIELLLASSALRDAGAGEVGLIAPYLPYMRQDIAFNAGEAVSQKVIGHLLAQYFDRFVSVDPHLHRTPTLVEVFQGKPAVCVTAASAIANHIVTQGSSDDAVIIGPDIESKSLAHALAEPLGVPWIVAAKTRHGDRDVHMKLENSDIVKGRPAIIVDDVISSGTTIVALTQLLNKAGATSIEVYTTHALFDDTAHTAMKNVGVRSIISTDSVPHSTNGVSLAFTLAEGLRSWP